MNQRAVDLTGWEARYRSGERREDDLNFTPTPLLVRSLQDVKPGRALDLACGTGRNALWLAEQGWDVTAVDGSTAAIDILQGEAARRNLTVSTHVSDLERGFPITPNSWDLITMLYYLQRDLFAPAKDGLRDDGRLIAIVHITQGDEEPNAHRLRPGELRTYFAGWHVQSYAERKPQDPQHRRAAAEIVVRKPV